MNTEVASRLIDTDECRDLSRLIDTDEYRGCISIDNTDEYRDNISIDRYLRLQKIIPGLVQTLKKLLE